MITALLEVAQTDLVEEVVTVSGQFKQNLYGLIEKILKTGEIFCGHFFLF